MREKKKMGITETGNKEIQAVFFEKKSVSIMKQICFFVISMFIVFLFYSFSLVGIKKMKEKEAFADCSSVYADNTDYELSYRIESMELIEDKLEFSGWAFDLSSTNSNIQVALKDAENSEVILCKTKLVARDDIEQYYGSISSCGKVGFFSQIAQRKLHEEKCYEVLLGLEYEDSTVQRFSTGSYLYNGELYKYNPLKFTAPVVENEEFIEAIRRGEVCAYDLEKKMWIYKYNGSLYYIIDYSLIGDVEQKPKFPVYLYTSQIGKLPENVRAEEMGRADYVLKSHECMNENNNEFYLLTVPLNVEYPITCIRTGLYQGEEWDWMVTFRP